MSQLGIDATLRTLARSSEYDAVDCIGRLIADAKIEDNKLLLTFQDGKRIAIFNEGQSSYEYRHMTTDDDISSLVGQTLMRIDGKDGPSTDGGEEGLHETCFVEVGTDAGFITLVNHNERNGFYCGFGLTIKEIVMPLDPMKSENLL